MTQQSKLMPTIIIVIEQNGGEFAGTEQLALEVNAPKRHVTPLARRLACLGLITIVRSNGGRGNKTKYISRTPGLARRTR
jgi:DNA-binding IscR family transcriptional regulator